VPHHVTQRGNRGCLVFSDDADRRLYLSLLADYAERYGLAVFAYCLMTNHVHFVAVPSLDDSMGRTFRDTQQAYASKFNRKIRESGHLWQGRFYSCPLDERHFWAAVRYVERNPVRANLAPVAWEYPWSSAAAHCGLRIDPLLSGDLDKADHVGDWKAFLLDEDDTALHLLRTRTRTGRPCGQPSFVEELETRLGRALAPRKPGPASQRVAGGQGGTDTVTCDAVPHTKQL
jgi:putative transposase